jgi:hypothetical protein
MNSVAAADYAAVLVYECPVSDRSTDRPGVQLDRRDRSVGELLRRDRAVAKLPCSYAAGGEAQGIRGTAERNEQREVADRTSTNVLDDFVQRPYLPARGPGYPLGVVPAPISDMGPLGPVRACGALLAAGLLAPALFVREAALAAGAGELSAWLVSRGV